MSIVSLEYLYYHGNQNTVNAVTWMFSQIDYRKLLDRVSCAHMNPEKTTKCVLLEYSHTTHVHAQNGIPYVVEYWAGTNVTVNSILNSPDFIRTVDQAFSNGNKRIKVYTRQKINSDGTPNFNRKQLVVMFEPWAFMPPPLPPSAESSVMYESEDDE